MAGHITIEKAGGTWVVRAGGSVIGESADALILREEGYPEVVYFPRGDIAMAFLDRSEKTTTCPHKGDATYFSLQTSAGSFDDAAWSYEAPKPDMVQIAGHLAFGDEITVERV